MYMGEHIADVPPPPPPPLSPFPPSAYTQSNTTLSNLYICSILSWGWCKAEPHLGDPAGFIGLPMGSKCLTDYEMWEYCQSTSRAQA